MFLIICLSVFYFMSDPTGLQIGDKAPTFSALDQSSKAVDLEESLKNGKVVLTFFRGSWCRYCMKQFNDYQDSLFQYTAKGATLIAVTPQKAEGITRAIEISDATFSILHDEDLSIMLSYGVISEEKVADFRANFIDQEEDNSRKFLPVPATYIISQEGIIEYVSFDPNYKVRISNKELLKHL